MSVKKSTGRRFNIDSETMPSCYAILQMAINHCSTSDEPLALCRDTFKIPKTTCDRIMKGRTSRTTLIKLAKRMKILGMISQVIVDAVIIECTISKGSRDKFEPTVGQWHWVVTLKVEERLYTHRDDWVAFKDMNTANRMKRKALLSLQQQRFVKFKQGGHDVSLD